MPKDDRGLYYYPNLNDKSVRMYVRETHNGVEFRLWNSNYPDVWDHHDWLPFEVVNKAAELYKRERDNSTDPLSLYDVEIARRLIKEDGKTNT